MNVLILIQFIYKLRYKGTDCSHYNNKNVHASNVEIRPANHHIYSNLSHVNVLASFCTLLGRILSRNRPWKSLHLKSKSTITNLKQLYIQLILYLTWI